MINKDLLKRYADGIGVPLDDVALNRFDIYAKLLVETNKVMNLTGIIYNICQYFTISLSSYVNDSFAHNCFSRLMIMNPPFQLPPFPNTAGQNHQNLCKPLLKHIRLCMSSLYPLS